MVLRRKTSPLSSIKEAYCCTSFVCSSSKDNLLFPVRFRMWNPGENPTDNCTIIEAALATCAAPRIIAGVEIMGQVGPISYIGADLRWNNPVGYVWQEARSEFLSCRNANTCIVSIGTGKERVIAIQPSEFAECLKQIARDCEETSEMASKHCDAMKWKYVRLNVDQGIQGMAWKEWGEHGGLIEQHTRYYLQKIEVDNKLKLLLENIESRISLV